ncbi:hypothetical protein ACFQ0K_09290 [Nocardioides caeni]|uniref:TetR/AcrR family transcriptional regulator n=1 Tax=Nocardioides caeni TaxID=574700 RepID=A0A4S8N0X5_9ACTN|nr:TetR/AcrR family transcriptional regulator [Nocardioides caeni]THV09152.1 TetR/AcrR family transcriptional regulator [Nocardioides caeni]
MSSTPSTAPRKPNRRGVAAREKLLATALELLSTGKPETVSINLVAKESGLSWGSVQNLFGDSDGFWSSVVELIIDAPGLWAEPESDTVAGRVAEVAALYQHVLESPYAIAVETVRAALPRPLAVLAETHPRTAASVAHLDELWEQGFTAYFDGLDVAPERILDVSPLLQSALRGLRQDQLSGSGLDLERARATLITTMSAYLEG